MLGLQHTQDAQAFLVGQAQLALQRRVAGVLGSDDQASGLGHELGERLHPPAASVVLVVIGVLVAVRSRVAGGPGPTCGVHRDRRTGQRGRTGWVSELRGERVDLLGGGGVGSGVRGQVRGGLAGGLAEGVGAQRHRDARLGHALGVQVGLADVLGLPVPHSSGLQSARCWASDRPYWASLLSLRPKHMNAIWERTMVAVRGVERSWSA